MAFDPWRSARSPNDEAARPWVDDAFHSADFKPIGRYCYIPAPFLIDKNEIAQITSPLAQQRLNIVRGRQVQIGLQNEAREVNDVRLSLHLTENELQFF